MKRQLFLFDSGNSFFYDKKTRPSKDERVFGMILTGLEPATSTLSR